jgi:hypothetical protein
MDRIAHLLTAALVTIDTVVILGPGGSSALTQQAAKQALAAARPNRRRPVR